MSFEVYAPRSFAIFQLIPIQPVTLRGEKRLFRRVIGYRMTTEVEAVTSRSSELGEPHTLLPLSLTGKRISPSATRFHISHNPSHCVLKISSGWYNVKWYRKASSKNILLHSKSANSNAEKRAVVRNKLRTAVRVGTGGTGGVT
ncbi:hypothetical protein V3C99_010844 [Haemonchus contortus]